MHPKKRFTFLSVVLLFSLILSFVFPVSVLADDSEPVPTETPEVLPPTEPSVVSEETPTPEVTMPADSSPPVSEAMETQTTEEEVEVEETENVNLAEIVTSAAENNLTLANPGGEPLTLGTVEAAETLSAGDPYIIRGGVTHRFLSDCTGQPIDAFNTCTVSATPIQAAIDFAVPYETVFVESGTYYEQLVINTANLVLQGDPGNLTLAGAGPNAPILDGSIFSGSSVGITVYAEGFTLRGFIIQNFDTAIWQQTLSGNNTVTYDNNVIRNCEPTADRIHSAASA